MGQILRSFKTASGELTPDASPRDKDLVMYLRLPSAIAYRLDRQVKRLSCTRNVFARMAVIQFIEKQESIENENKS
jgi:hypothetical protein